MSEDQLKSTSAIQEMADQIDFGWLLVRLSLKDNLFQIQQGNQVQAFNAIINKDQLPPQSTVGYCQTIDSSPTNMATVYTLLKRSITMGDQLSQQDIIITFDLAIYAKAVEIIWKNSEEWSRIVPRLGAFHISCCFLAIIGKRFRDAGLTDLLIESEVIDSGSISGVTEGRQYNRGVRAHKIVMEALWRLRWKSFGIWLAEQDQNFDQDVLVGIISNIRNDLSNVAFTALLESDQFLKAYTSYKQFISCSKYPMFLFWSSYIEIVCLLLKFIRATREGNWNLHLSRIRDMLPWVTSYNRISYSRYLPIYWCQMNTLSETHPQAQHYLHSGEFAVQRSQDVPFSQVAVDHTIEQTLNKDTKTKGVSLASV